MSAPPAPPALPPAPQRSEVAASRDSNASGTAAFANALAAGAGAMARRVSETPLYKEKVDWDINNKPLDQRVNQSFTYDLEPVQGTDEAHTLTFSQHAQNLGGVVWTAAIQLGKFFEIGPSLRGQNILELGSGTGLVGLAVACLGANVVVTDLADVCTTLRENVAKNQDVVRSAGAPCRAPTVEVLAWGDDSHVSHLRQKEGMDNINLIIGSDLIHCHAVVQPLLHTLLALTSVPDAVYTAATPTVPPKTILSFDSRGREGVKSFLSMCEEHFEVERFDQTTLPSRFQFDRLFIVTLTRKSKAAAAATSAS